MFTTCEKYILFVISYYEHSKNNLHIYNALNLILKLSIKEGHIHKYP